MIILHIVVSDSISCRIGTPFFPPLRIFQVDLQNLEITLCRGREKFANILRLNIPVEQQAEHWTGTERDEQQHKIRTGEQYTDNFSKSKTTRTPIGAWKCSFPPFWEIMTDRPFDLPTDRRTD